MNKTPVDGISDTPRTDAIRDRLHASFVNWPEEAQDGIERYDELCRTLERELSARRETGMVLVPLTTINDLLSVDPRKCPAKVREAMYELTSYLASRPTT